MAFDPEMQPCEIWQSYSQVPRFRGHAATDVNTMRLAGLGPVGSAEPHSMVMPGLHGIVPRVCQSALMFSLVCSRRRDDQDVARPAFNHAGEVQAVR